MIIPEKELKLAENINHFKEKHSYYFKDLAKICGVNVQTLANWSQGQSPKNINDVRKLAEALKVSLYFLLYGESDPFQESIIEDQDARKVLKALAEYLKKINN